MLPTAAHTSTTSAQAWAQDLLSAVGGAQTQTTIDALVAWEHAESGSTPTFRNNPLNVTLRWPGGRTPGPAGRTWSTAAPLPGNEAGVAVFRTWTSGVQATAVRLLHTSIFSGILSQLRQGTTTAGLSSAVVPSGWGTSTFAGGDVGLTSKLKTGGGGGAGVGIAPILSQAQSMLTDANSLTHDLAVVLDRFFGMFAPGQGMRIGIGAGTVLCAVEGVRSWRSATSERGGGSFPLAVALIGLAVAGAFISLRPWPKVNGKPIKPGAYAVDVFEGHPPTVTAATHSRAVTAIQGGIDSLLLLWAVGKIARAFGAVSGALRGALGAGGPGGAPSEGSGAPSGTGEATAGTPATSGTEYPTGPPLIDPTGGGGIDIGGGGEGIPIDG